MLELLMVTLKIYMTEEKSIAASYYHVSWRFVPVAGKSVDVDEIKEVGI